MFDADGHIEHNTGLTPAVTISKNGGAFGAALGAVTEIGHGWYALAANATDRNTLGDFTLHADAAEDHTGDHTFAIVAHNPFEAIWAIQLSLVNITNCIGAFTGSGVNTLLGFFKALLSKSATLPTDVGGTFDPATDSTEAIKDAGISADSDAIADAVVAKLGAAPITILSPMDALTGDVTVVIGQSYESGEITWTDTGDVWPEITGATLTFEVEGNPAILWTPVEITGGAHQAVKLTLTSQQTDDLVVNAYQYKIWATTYTGSPAVIATRHRLASGTLTAVD